MKNVILASIFAFGVSAFAEETPAPAPQETPAATAPAAEQPAMAKKAEKPAHGKKHGKKKEAGH